MSIDEMIKWVIDVDRRIVAIKGFIGHPHVRAANIAGASGRSVQNISRALHEFEEKGLVESLSRDKHTWKKYLLTEEGRRVLAELEKRNMLQ